MGYLVSFSAQETCWTRGGDPYGATICRYTNTRITMGTSTVDDISAQAEMPSEVQISSVGRTRGGTWPLRMRRAATGCPTHCELGIAPVRGDLVCPALCPHREWGRCGEERGYVVGG